MQDMATTGNAMTGAGTQAQRSTDRVDDAGQGARQGAGREWPVRGGHTTKDHARRCHDVDNDTHVCNQFDKAHGHCQGRRECRLRAGQGRAGQGQAKGRRGPANVTDRHEHANQRKKATP